MRIDGHWVVGVDGVERPSFPASLLLPRRQLVPLAFVLDTGADLTLLPFGVGQALASVVLPQPGPVVSGAGGIAATLLLEDVSMTSSNEPPDPTSATQPPAAQTGPASIVQSQSGGINLGVNTQIGQVGDLV